MITNPSLRVERVHEPPRDALAALVDDSERQGLRLVRRLADEWASGANRFDRPGEALFMAWIGGNAVGVGGLNIDPYTAATGVGRVRHVYVLAAHRRVGVGEQLLHAILGAARGRFDVVRLRTTNPAAARLYERLGFEPVDEADCSHTLTLRAVAA